MKKTMEEVPVTPYWFKVSANPSEVGVSIPGKI